MLALDQGTTSSRSIIFDHRGSLISQAQRVPPDLSQNRAGWNTTRRNLEHWFGTMAEAAAKAGITMRQIAGIGITNQRETTVVWDRSTGKPVYHAIVWQDRRPPLLR